jgi:uncharacterized protein DUF397
MANEHIWRRSRRSQNGQNCVELRDTLDQVRDSKNTAGRALSGDVRALLLVIRSGGFDR